MKDPEAYRGREQSYLKHFFLERYLERVAFKIGWANPEFVYIDGFSGPWRSEDEGFEDTSFMIAINELRRVRDIIAEKDANRAPRIRCLFVESDPKAFVELQQATSSVKDMDVHVLPGEFEQVLPTIVDRVGDSFALTFIDPTGWTGFALRTIAPLLEKRGEVLINFMFDYINRFRAGDRDTTADTFDSLFGGPGWDEAVRAGESSMLDFYQQRLKDTCAFPHATRTRILKPLSERTFFHLVYATRHIDGLVEFRRVEKKLLREQEQVRADTKQSARVAKSGQREFFREADAHAVSFETEQLRNLRRAGEALRASLDTKIALRYERALAPMLEIPMVDEPAAKRIMMDLRSSGCIEVNGLRPRQRLPDRSCTLRRLE